eukprot:scaffold2062_cov58-Phaeocystis_antarctica.AAC.2
MPFSESVTLFAYTINILRQGAKVKCDGHVRARLLPCALLDEHEAPEAGGGGGGGGSAARAIFQFSSAKLS